MDLRNSRAFPSDARELMKEAILFCKQVGMERNAVVLNSAIATLQARRLGKETGIDRWARYIDASRPDWEKIALDWLVKAKDPEQHH
jgi:hypothetical protein